MYLFLIRHGETDWNLQERVQGRQDTPLNARGVEQVKQLAARLAAEERMDVIYSSPLTRAQETAQALGSRMGLPVVLDERLVERSVGALEGMTLQEIEERYPGIMRAWRTERHRVVLPGGERQEELYTRIASFRDMLWERHAEQRVAIVSHGGTLSMLLAIWLDLDIFKPFPFRFDNASVSQVDYARERPRIDLLNDTCHLRAALPRPLPIHPEPSRDETAIATSLESE